jgi:hypothetical protein
VLTTPARDAVRLLKDAGILEIVTPAAVLATYERPVADAIHRNMADREFLSSCDAQSQASNKQRWTLSLAILRMNMESDLKFHHLKCAFAHEVAGDQR